MGGNGRRPARGRRAHAGCRRRGARACPCRIRAGPGHRNRPSTSTSKSKPRCRDTGALHGQASTSGAPAARCRRSRPPAAHGWPACHPRAMAPFLPAAAGKRPGRGAGGTKGPTRRRSGRRRRGGHRAGARRVLTLPPSPIRTIPSAPGSHRLLPVAREACMEASHRATSRPPARGLVVTAVPPRITAGRELGPPPAWGAPSIPGWGCEPSPCPEGDAVAERVFVQSFTSAGPVPAARPAAARPKPWPGHGPGHEREGIQ